MREWALLNTAIVVVVFFLILYGLYLSKIRRDLVRHPKVMIAAGGVFVLFLISFVAKILTVGTQPIPVWDAPLLGVQPRHILYFHEAVALVTVPLIVATYWMAATKRFHIHRRIAPWAAGLWLFMCLFGVLEYFILYHT